MSDLHTLITQGLMERLGDIKRDFPTVLEIGQGALAPLLVKRTRTVIQLSDVLTTSSTPPFQGVKGKENAPPFQPNTFDAILSAGTMQRDNTPSLLKTLLSLLKPDGLLLYSLIGKESLKEYAELLIEAQTHSLGGAHAPQQTRLLTLKDATDMLTKAGFALTVGDRQTYTLSYTTFKNFLKDYPTLTPLPLQPLTKDIHHYIEKDITAHTPWTVTWELLFLTGWKPDPCQPKPLKPNEGVIPLSQVL